MAHCYRTSLKFICYSLQVRAGILSCYAEVFFLIVPERPADGVFFKDIMDVGQPANGILAVRKVNHPVFAAVERGIPLL